MNKFENIKTFGEEITEWYPLAAIKIGGGFSQRQIIWFIEYLSCTDMLLLFCQTVNVGTLRNALVNTTCSTYYI